MLTILPSMAAPRFVKMTTSGANSDGTLARRTKTSCIFRFNDRKDINEVSWLYYSISYIASSCVIVTSVCDYENVALCTTRYKCSACVERLNTHPPIENVKVRKLPKYRWLEKISLRKQIRASWLWFNIKMLSYQYRKSHCGDKTILRPSYLHNGISYTGKMASLYQINASGIF